MFELNGCKSVDVFEGNTSNAASLSDIMEKIRENKASYEEESFEPPHVGHGDLFNHQTVLFLRNKTVLV